MRAREREEQEIERNEKKALARYSHVFIQGCRQASKQASRDDEQQGRQGKRGLLQQGSQAQKIEYMQRGRYDGRGTYASESSSLVFSLQGTKQICK